MLFGTIQQIQMHCRFWQAKSAWDHIFKCIAEYDKQHPRGIPGILYISRGTGAASHPYPESIMRGMGAASDPDPESSILYPSTGSYQMLFGTIPQIQMHCRA